MVKDAVVAVVEPVQLGEEKPRGNGRRRPEGGAEVLAGDKGERHAPEHGRERVGEGEQPPQEHVAALTGGDELRGVGPVFGGTLIDRVEPARRGMLERDGAATTRPTGILERRSLDLRAWVWAKVLWVHRRGA